MFLHAVFIYPQCLPFHFAAIVIVYAELKYRQRRHQAADKQVQLFQERLFSRQVETSVYFSMNFFARL